MKVVLPFVCINKDRLGIREESEGVSRSQRIREIFV